MINNEILSFIKDQVAQGSTKDQVKDMLVTQGGWDDKDVEEAFETINFSGTSYPTVLKNAMADAEKVDEKAQKEKLEEKILAKSGFASAGELMKASSLSSAPATDVRPAVTPQTFSPGLSHMEQPKSMQPSPAAPSFSADIAPRSQVISQPQKAAPENFPAGGTGGDALAGLRARIASGVSTGAMPVAIESPVATFPPTVQPMKSPAVQPLVQPLVRPAVQPIIKEPNIPPVSKPFVAAPTIRPTSSISPATMPSIIGDVNGVISPRPAPSLPPLQGMGQGGNLPPLTSLPKTSMLQPAMSSPQTMQQQPASVFPKGQLVGGAVNSHMMNPTPAQLAALRGQKQGGGRFLLGLMMLLIGIALGGLAMNAYMNGYVTASTVNGIVEKGMNMVGLGTPAPAVEPPTAPAVVPTTAPKTTAP